MSKNNTVLYKKLNSHVPLRRLKSAASSKAKKVYIEFGKEGRNATLLALGGAVKKRLATNQNRYRFVGTRPFIETIARLLAREILIENQFNAFEAFKCLCAQMKIYKKEAQVLNLLLIRELLALYDRLLADTNHLRSQVLRGARLRRLGAHAPLPTVYGAIRLNPSSTRFAAASGLALKATGAVISRLDETAEKQEVLFRYISFLSRGII